MFTLNDLDSTWIRTKEGTPQKGGYKLFERYSVQYKGHTWPINQMFHDPSADNLLP
jgi:hypothetical protein